MLLLSLRSSSPRTVAPAVVGDIPVTAAAMLATVNAKLERIVIQISESITVAKALEVDGDGESSGCVGTVRENASEKGFDRTEMMKLR
jgi:hypothetical protein